MSTTAADLSSLWPQFQTDEAEPENSIEKLSRAPSIFFSLLVIHQGKSVIKSVVGKISIRLPDEYVPIRMSAGVLRFEVRVVLGRKINAEPEIRLEVKTRYEVAKFPEVYVQLQLRREIGNRAYSTRLRV